MCILFKFDLDVSSQCPTTSYPNNFNISKRGVSALGTVLNPTSCLLIYGKEVRSYRGWIHKQRFGLEASDKRCSEFGAFICIPTLVPRDTHEEATLSAYFKALKSILKYLCRRWASKRKCRVFLGRLWFRNFVFVVLILILYIYCQH
jgi:hypothetical protein